MTGQKASPESFASIIGDRVGLLRWLRSESEPGEHAIDYAVSGLDPLWPLRLTGGWRLGQCLRYDIGSWSWVLERGGELVALNTLEDPRGLGRYGFPSVLGLDGPGGLASAGARAAYLTATSLGAGILGDAEWTQIQTLAREDPDGYLRTLEHVLGRRPALKLFREALAGDAPPRAFSRPARRAQRLRRLRAPRLALLFVMLEARRKLERLTRPTGLLVLVVGPDGSGKSTLASMLPEANRGLFRFAIHQHFRPGLLPRPGSLVRKGERDWSKPHAPALHGRMVSLVLLTYFWLDFLIGGWLRIWPSRVRTGLVVAERGWWDLAVDPRRYRLQVPATLVRVLGRFLQRPDLVLVLEAPSAAIVERKDELPAAELMRQVRAWHDVIPANVRRAYIDASNPVRDVVQAAREEVVRLLEARAISRLGAGWVALPRPGKGAPTSSSPGTVPRLMLPRGPRATARAGLMVYHPCTRRGRVAWESARLLATLGSLRVVPRGEVPPRAVREVLAPHLPPRSTFAVAESNDAGRFIAMIVDERGVCRAVAKIATVDAGRLALEKEASALLSLGKLLPPPLRAPRLLTQDEGLLVLEAVQWLPRLRPWLLPDEVARALGTFFGAGIKDGGDVGPIHGDFAPWNVLQTERDWVLVDWEQAHDKGQPFFDLFHYLVLAHLNLERPSQRALLAGLEGKGWVGRVIAAYAEGAQLHSENARERLISYLGSSSESLNAATPAGRAGLRGREKLLQSLEA